MQELTGISTVKTEEVEHHLWKKAFKIYNDTVQLLVLTEVGPRILFFGFLGEENEFHEIPEHSGKRGDQTFRALWRPSSLGITGDPAHVLSRQSSGWVGETAGCFCFYRPSRIYASGHRLAKGDRDQTGGHRSAGHGHTPHPQYWARTHRDGSMGIVGDGRWREGHSPSSAARADVSGQIITRRSPCSVVLHRLGRSTMEDRHEVYAASPDKQLCRHIQGADGGNL